MSKLGLLASVGPLPLFWLLNSSCWLGTVVGGGRRLFYYVDVGGLGQSIQDATDFNALIPAREGTASHLNAPFCLVNPGLSLGKVGDRLSEGGGQFFYLSLPPHPY